MRKPARVMTGVSTDVAVHGGHGLGGDLTSADEHGDAQLTCEGERRGYINHLLHDCHI